MSFLKGPIDFFCVFKRSYKTNSSAVDKNPGQMADSHALVTSPDARRRYHRASPIGHTCSYSHQDSDGVHPTGIEAKILVKKIGPPFTIFELYFHNPKFWFSFEIIFRNTSGEQKQIQLDVHWKFCASPRIKNPLAVFTGLQFVTVYFCKVLQG